MFDPTGSSGTTVEDQVLLRDELHGRVSKVRDDLEWLDIISKVDQPIPDLNSLQKRYVVNIEVDAWWIEEFLSLT